MLFKKTADLLNYADISTSINFAAIKRTIQSVEDQHIVEILGKQLYKSLQNSYLQEDIEDNLSPAKKQLLHYCRCVIAPYFCYYYAPKADVKLSDSGMNRLETANMKSAFQEQRTDYKEANLTEAEIASEQLLEFLEENKTDYPDWANSEAFAEYRSLFIKSGNDFQRCFRSNSPYRNYWAMRGKMVDVEENNIRVAIGSTLFDYLKAKHVIAGTFTAKEKDLLFKLKKAIAYFTVAFSIPYLNIRLDANGFTVASSATATRDADAKRSAASDSAMSSLARSSNDAGQTWLANALTFLKDNKSDFPSWLIPVETEEDSINGQLSGSFGLC